MNVTSARTAPRTPHPDHARPIDALTIPGSWTRRLSAARAIGMGIGETLPTITDSPARRARRAHIIAAIGTPPSPSQQSRELIALHRLAARRTPDATAAARHLGNHGTASIWTEKFDELNTQQPLSDAAAGAALLKQAMNEATYIASAAKQQWKRPRPFSADASLTTVVPRPRGATSFPSNHAAVSFAASGLLERLWPHATGDLRSLAESVAFSRLYGGVHFPSDVLAGAKIGAATAAFIGRAWNQ